MVLSYSEIHIRERFHSAVIAGESSPLPSEVRALIQLTVKGMVCKVRTPLAFPECRQVGAWVWEPGVAGAPASPLLPAKQTLVSSRVQNRARRL